jgi:VWFA-related protein
VELRIGIGLAVTLALACMRGAGGQQPENSVVNLSVVALDNRGQPVNDLTEDDFEVIDAGKPRKIAFARHIDRRLTQTPTTGPNEFSNRARFNIPHATVILLDLMNQRFDTRGQSANQIVRYLQTVESADFLYLYFLTIDGRIYGVRGLPGQEGAISEEEPQWTTRIKTIMDTAMRTVLRNRPVDMDVAVRVQLTFAALETLAAQMSLSPGRKNIVWITDGVPISLGPIRSDTGDIVDFTPRLRRLSAALERSHIAIYPVRQIMIGSQDAPPDAPGVPHDGATNGVLSTETLNQFAAMTGGRPDGGRDVGTAVSQAMNDARTSYEIGYYAPLETWDSKFHKLRVTCRRKGVRIQTKTGYYAWPEDPTEEARKAIQAAASQAFDAAEIGIRATLSPASSGAGGAVHLKVVMDAKDLALMQETDGYKGQLSIAVVGYNSNGAARSSAVRPLDLNYTAQDRDKVLSQGVDYAFDVPVGDDIAAVRFIALDNIAQTTGSITIPVRETGKGRSQ